MYISITKRCNMKCGHCCYSCTSKGEDMPWEVFHAIIDKWGVLYAESNSYVSLGGGEPTLHPKFWSMVYYVQGVGLTPWVATNGKQKEDALVLCEMARQGKVAAALSLDKWHEPIDEEVVAAFKTGLKKKNHKYYETWMNYKDRENDLREIRTAIIPYYGGRAKNLKPVVHFCPCVGINFEPNGDILACGCDDSPVIGHYRHGIKGREWKYYDINNGCWKKQNGLYKGR